MGYVESGYWETGYAEGDSAPINSVLHFRVDVKKTSTKTDAEVIAMAKAEVEVRQALAGDLIGVYADVYDVRNKTITRVFSDVARYGGIGGANTLFGGDIEQITNITNAIDARVTATSASISNALTPRLKLVNPFESLILDTQMTASNGTYLFEFDTAQIGAGNYHLEVEFVAPVAGA